MQKIYTILGFLLFWGGLAATIWWNGTSAWNAKWFASTRRRFSNFYLSVRILFGYRLPLSHDVTRIVPRYGGTPNVWRASQWERDMICFCIRHARKTGYTPSRHDV